MYNRFNRPSARGIWQKIFETAAGATGLAKAMLCAYGVALVVNMALVEWYCRR
jgi:hypothetical protein